jgi:2,3-bisphosphoglycerate-independent phosphoglycerate mutase
MSTRISKSSPQSDRSPCLLVIRDGWGLNPNPEHDPFNAVHLARTPVADDLARKWPTSLLKTSGPDVGLPNGTDGPVMGNSEVGHQNIGAGRIIDQELMRINRSIEQGSFFENVALDSAFGCVESTGGRVHLLGLISEGQVHSDLDHVVAVIEFARRRGVPADRLAVHAITDGRDTPPTAGRDYIQRLEKALSDRGYPPVASVMGRYWAMDRDNRWDRIERAWHCLVTPPDEVLSCADEALVKYYDAPTEPSLHGDEFVPPVAIGADLDTARRSRISNGDSVLFMNFRGDRPRELTKAFVLDDQAWSEIPRGGFVRTNRPENIRFTGLTRYEEGLPIEVAFEKPEKKPMILGETIAGAGLTQLRCAETEKFPHVTFFFNDYREKPFPNERRIMLDSPTDVVTYDQKPEMSAHGVRDAVLERLAAEDCEDLIIVNFANGDMVGHTGSLEAAVKACEVVDSCVGQLVEATLARGGSLLITADHGNAEQMWNPEADCPHTAHTNYDVPIHLVGEGWKDIVLREGGRLADIAPTILELLEVERPVEMSGSSLIT